MSENTQTNVVPLKTRPQIAREDTIAMLEDILQRAKDGEIVMAAVAYVKISGAINTAIGSCEDCGPLIGAVALLQHRICFSAE